MKMTNNISKYVYHNIDSS